ncbi:glycosyltransferase [Aliivibrio fischeri]|uniref:sulfotransferase family 2 domain-containing protein n=1 Tax=Aliivibrio fischeri TaxID=668 RepID=UPI0012DA499E|nr:sulfotransferase family 2 domain-containing protein [Aliivibrio fischeri]MUJ28015.1 glycosyltransferase [Aliivibrio fischeri]
MNNKAEIKYSKKYKIAYINNPKVACSTISRSLIGHNVKNLHDKNNFSVIKDGTEEIFSVVRNPYDRALSGYLNKIGPERDDPYTWNKFKIRYNLNKEHLSFKEFLYCIYNDKDVDNIDPHFRPQNLNLDYKNIKPNFIGRIEDMSKVEQYLLEFNVKFVVRNKNKTDAKNKKDKFYDKECISLVKKIYEDDFHLYGYDNLILNTEILPPIQNENSHISSEYLKKKVAIITRTKDRPITLERAIQSVLSQTEQDWIHVIVNDGGEQSCVNQLVEKYEFQYRNRIMVIHNPQSLGMEAASNIGLKASESEYILIHDDDDSLNETFLSVSTKALEECQVPSVKGVVTHTTQIFEEITSDNIIFSHTQPFDPYLSAISLQKICEINKFMPISFLYERSVFNDIGYYDESLPVCGDWDFNIRFLMKFDIFIIKKELANYHIRTNKASNYENTVTQSRDKHLFYRSLIINKHFRNDLESGDISISHLLSLGEATHDISSNTWVIARIVNKLINAKMLYPIKRLFRK